MPDAYVYIPKPTGTPYTNINTVGKEQYDQSNIEYDDVNVFYDGVDSNAYTNISKPQIQYQTLYVGYTQGLLIPLTRSSIIGQIEVSPYTNVSKPTS